ncbi:helix-turn-helix transcriptional regulator [Clostridium sp.]|uniref:helix-turn-helix transcriptional regulator n=1 Tax=Clostridium sp. TaxID=1506 RepID=UPI0029004EAE|nr:helix-turn-helix transcriptional regulator [Clostridium sp.]MDU1843630.1 helix-turn-helix transcriptional regulator [Clostridium sp.]
MDVAKKIRIMLVEENLKIIDLADRLNTSQQNISAKLKRNNFSVKEMEEIAEALGYSLEINFTKKE